MIVSSRLFSSRLSWPPLSRYNYFPRCPPPPPYNVSSTSYNNNRAIVRNNLLELEEIARALNRAEGSCRFFRREECKFPRGGTRAGHTAQPHARSSRGRRSSTWTTGRGACDAGMQGRANKKVMKRGETNSSAERNNIRGRYSRFVEAAGPFDSDRGRKETRADSTRSWATVQSDEIARNYARARP